MLVVLVEGAGAQKHEAGIWGSGLPHNSGIIFSRRERRLAVLFQQSHCLSILWQIFSLDLATSSKKFSRLAALMKLNCAEESQDEFQVHLRYFFSLLCQPTLLFACAWRCQTQKNSIKLPLHSKCFRRNNGSDVNYGKMWLSTVQCESLIWQKSREK